MKILSPYQTFEDERGCLLGLLNHSEWQEINFLETRAGNQRGNHYHKNTREFFFIIEGRGEIEIISESQGKEVHEFKSLDMFIIEPMEIHTFYCHENTKWINALTLKFDADNPDIHLPER
ncbi:cupin domain-containing protein [Methylophaga thalassica]|uniref:cupin domain-containing protein n=1 Tax=Methylophaga aminisulfidivorans TaxID=230105 RepID=UPI003A9359D2